MAPKIFVLTSNALYSLDFELLDKVRSPEHMKYMKKLKFSRCTSMQAISKVSVSSFADNYFVLHTNGKAGDTLFTCNRKTEFLSTLSDAHQKATRQPLKPEVNATIDYAIKGGKKRTVVFEETESKSRTVTTEPAGKESIKVTVPTSLKQVKPERIEEMLVGFGGKRGSKARKKGKS